MENINPINPEPTKLSQSEVDQIARIMESLKNKTPAKPKFVIKPPTAPAAPEIKVEPLAATQTASFQPPSQRLTKEEYYRIRHSAPITIPPETMAKLQDTVISNIANERAEREPFPDHTAEVFDPASPDIEVFNLDTKQKETLHVRGIVPADMRIFKLLDSPMYKLIVGELPKQEDALRQFQIDSDALYDLAYQFIVDPRTAYNLVKKSVDKFHETSFELAFKYDAEDLFKVVEAVIHYFGKTNNSKVECTTVTTPEEGEAEASKKKAE